MLLSETPELQPNTPRGALRFNHSVGPISCINYQLSFLDFQLENAELVNWKHVLILLCMFVGRSRNKE